MTTTIISTDTDFSAAPDGLDANAEWVLQQGVKATSTGGAILASTNADVTVEIDGTASSNAAGSLAAFGLTGDGATFVIGATGAISADVQTYIAVQLGTDAQVTNAGTVTAVTEGFFLGAGSSLDNSGTIAGTGANNSATAIYGNTDIEITNSGNITATDDAIVTLGGVISNSGTIAGDIYAIWEQLDPVTIQNSGLISGGAQAVVMNTGTIINAATGEIRSGAGIFSYQTLALDNAGLIQSTDASQQAIYAAGSGSTVTNSGTINAAGDAVYLDGGGTVTNSGTISSGTGVAVTLSLAGVLNNTGTITAELIAVQSFSGADTVINAGTIQGMTALGGGNDRFDGSAATFSGTVLGEAGNDTLIGGAHTEVFKGGAGNDSLSGGGGADQLLGGAGADALDGGAGNDLLTGGAGRDLLTGGAGADVFIYTALSDSGSVATQSFDLISGFTTGSDKIDLSQIDAIAGTAANDAFTFIGTAAFTHHAGQLHTVAQSNGVVVEADVDGDGVSDFAIQIYGPTALSAGDFML